MHGIARVAACGLLLGILSACASGSKTPPGVLPEFTTVPPPSDAIGPTGRAKTTARRGTSATAATPTKLTVPRSLR